VGTHRCIRAWGVRALGQLGMPHGHGHDAYVWELTLLWAPVLVLSLCKEGFVRADSSHAAIFFGAMVGGLFAFRLRWATASLASLAWRWPYAVSLAISVRPLPKSSTLQAAFRRWSPTPIS